VAFIEMARDEAHGGAGWHFLQCVWAPTEKEKGGRWPFWLKILEIREGDLVLHIRATARKSFFVGYSVASTDGYRTEERPPEPGDWEFSKAFLRADLKDFVPFQTPLSLATIFSSRRRVLEDYFDENKRQGKTKKNIFFVRQAGQLQCQNGGYLSELDDKLFHALFASEASQYDAHRPQKTVVNTAQQLGWLKTRIGQAEFSNEIGKLYSHRCCFPSCFITEPRFLVGSHIARWSDNETLRGNLGNGLCLCLMHDKAFEIGLFTLNDEYLVTINASVTRQPSAFMAALKAGHGKQIRLARILPSKEALAEHRKRFGIS